MAGAGLGRGAAPPDRALRPLRAAPPAPALQRRRLLGHRRRQGPRARQGGAGGSGVPRRRSTGGDRRARRCGCACPTTARPWSQDVIRGSSSFENRLLDDFVIARADRTPLYNFAVAVDDHEMGITHVVRGEDHLSNTPRQMLVLAALGAEAPLYAHLPLLHGTDGKPLSKRHGAASVQELRDGRLPARGDPQLPGAARLGLRRDHDVLLDGGAGGEILARARVALARGVRRAEAGLDERPLHPRDGAGGAAERRRSGWPSRACRERTTRCWSRPSPPCRRRSPPWPRFQTWWGSPSARSRSIRARGRR